MKKLLASILALTLCFPVNLMAGMADTDRADVDRYRNSLQNPGFESGKSKHVASSASTLTVTTSTPIEGKASGVFTPTVAAQTVSQVYAVPEILKGKNCAISFEIRTAVTDAKLQVWNGTNVLNEVVIAANTTARTHAINFACPTTGNIGYRILAGTSLGAITYDAGFIGDARGVNLGNVSQASAASASVTMSIPNNSSTTVTGLSVITDPESNFLTNKYVAKKSGNYHISATINLILETLGGGIFVAEVVKNGSTALVNDRADLATGSLIAGAGQVFTLTPDIIVPLVAGDEISIKILQQAGGNRNATVTFNVTRFPTSSQLAVTPDLTASSWSGYHDSTCSWTRNTTSFGDYTADATCGFSERTNTNFGTVTSYLSGSDKLPGIVFTPKMAGKKYNACATFSAYITGGASYAVRLYDGTTAFATIDGNAQDANERTTFNLCGIVTAADLSAKTLRVDTRTDGATTTLSSFYGNTVEWNIFDISQSLPSPILQNQVSTSNSGGERIARVAFSGNATWGNANCTSSPCTLNASDVSGVSVSWLNTGQYAINFPSGTFSAEPTCVANGFQVGAGYRIGTHLYMSGSATQVLTRCAGSPNNDTLVNCAMTVTCQGPR
jgi:hypothetical protein